MLSVLFLLTALGGCASQFPPQIREAPANSPTEQVVRGHVQQFVGTPLQQWRAEDKDESATPASPSHATHSRRPSNFYISTCCYCMARPMPRRAASPRRRRRLRRNLRREQLVLETELGEVADAAGIEHAVEMIAFVLHHARVKSEHLAHEMAAVLVVTAVTQMGVARHQTALH